MPELGHSLKEIVPDNNKGGIVSHRYGLGRYRRAVCIGSVVI